MPPRLTHCPETGISLEGRKLRTYAENMWPAKALDVNNPHCAEAIRRKALVMEEAELRDMDDKRKPSGTATASGAEKGKA